MTLKRLTAVALVAALAAAGCGGSTSEPSISKIGDQIENTEPQAFEDFCTLRDMYLRNHDWLGVKVGFKATEGVKLTTSQARQLTHDLAKRCK